MSLRKIASVSFAFLLIALCPVLVASNIAGLDFNKTINLITLIVLTLTLLVLCVYTVYTRLLHMAAQEQTRLSRMPSLIHKEEYDSHRKAKQLLIRNIGHGVAVNVRISNIEGKPIPNLHFKFEEIDYVYPDEEKELKVHTYINNKLFEEGWQMLQLGKNDIDVTQTIVFRFQDIDGRRYVQRNSIINGQYKHGIVEEECQDVVADCHDCILP